MLELFFELVILTGLNCKKQLINDKVKRQIFNDKNIFKSILFYCTQFCNNFNSLRPSDAYICVGNLTTIGSENGLSPGRRQAIIWTNAEILLIGPLGTNFSEIQIGIQAFSYKKMNLNMSSEKWRPFCLGPNVLRRIFYKHVFIYHFSVMR